MALINEFREQLKVAMKDHNEIYKDCYKNVIAKATNIAKDNKTEITDDIMITAITKEVKQLNETMSFLNGDNDLYKNSLIQRNLLDKYLPKMLTKSEIMEILEIEFEPVNDLKTLMPMAQKYFKNKADGKLVAECVKEFLFVKN